MRAREVSMNSKCHYAPVKVDKFAKPVIDKVELEPYTLLYTYRYTGVIMNHIINSKMSRNMIINCIINNTKKIIFFPNVHIQEKANFHLCPRILFNAQTQNSLFVENYSTEIEINKNFIP